ncbi:MAG: NAD kinase [Frankiaceae bacterium]
MTREVLVVAHTGRHFVREGVQKVLDQLRAAGIRPRVLDEEAGRLDLHHASVAHPDKDPAAGAELIVVLGGDGSLLRGAEFARAADVPLLGINLGHVGFLAEAEPEALETTVDRVAHGDYAVEQRMTLDVVVRHEGEVLYRGWALNEASIEKARRSRMLDCVLEVEGRPLSRWGCDGVVCATPTGSTAYAFSAGGPIVWPQVQATLVVPVSAHALFARPLVLSPDTAVGIEVLPGESSAVLSCDGRRSFPVSARSRIDVSRGSRSIQLVRMDRRPFTDRLVRKFRLPVEGWRGSGTG